MAPGLTMRKAACLLAALLLAGAAGASELVVIVSAKSPVTALGAQQVAAIFLSETGRYPQGGEAVAVDQRLGSPIRNEFYSKVASRTPALMKEHWSKMIFTGRGQPPREVRSSAAVRKLVAANPAMIGYIEPAALDASVRAVLVLN
ncbi:MAG: phosphate ABC transporter substrate-binding protein [Pseudomonadota bacterium]